MREFKDLKIAVAGTGYVGLSIAMLLSQHHKVTAVDIIPEKVELINNKKSPIQDEYIEKYLAEKELDLTATLVEFSAGDTNILVFRRLCRENHLHRLQMDAVHFTQCRQKANNDRSRRGQTANRQTSFNDAG